MDQQGLTAPEATFFAAGPDRAVLELEGLRCSAVICREIEDTEALAPGLKAEGVELVFWPGLMRPDPALPPQDPPSHVRQAQDLARRCAAHVIQTNWPQSLNRPEESAGTGRSACIAPDGQLLFRLPEQGFGLAVFPLGARGFSWLPIEARGGEAVSAFS